MDPLDMSNSTMYILVREGVKPSFVALGCAHASLSGYLTFLESEKKQFANAEDNPCDHPACRFHVSHACEVCGKIWSNSEKTSIERWAEQSFKKVICIVTNDQFEEAKTYGVIGQDYRVITESSLDNAELMIVFKPRVNWEEFFRNLPLYA